jgi:hypothetical protein
MYILLMQDMSREHFYIALILVDIFRIVHNEGYMIIDYGIFQTSKICLAQVIYSNYHKTTVTDIEL